MRQEKRPFGQWQHSSPSALHNAGLIQAARRAPWARLSSSATGVAIRAGTLGVCSTGCSTGSIPMRCSTTSTASTSARRSRLASSRPWARRRSCSSSSARTGWRPWASGSLPSGVDFVRQEATQALARHAAGDGDCRGARAHGRRADAVCRGAARAVTSNAWALCVRWTRMSSRASRPTGTLSSCACASASAPSMGFPPLASAHRLASSSPTTSLTIC